MARVLCWVGFMVLGLVVLLVLVAGFLYLRGNQLIARVYTTPASAPALAKSASQRARGEHLVRNVSQCAGCHGGNLGGALMVDEPAFATIYAPNLTTGEGGASRTFSPTDWGRALRHGVAPNGRGLAPMMPSEAYQNLSEADLAAIVVYLESVPPVANVSPEPRYGPVGKLLIGAGVLPLAPKLVADTPRLEPESVAEGTSEGAYLSHIAGCTVCHGADLRGTEGPGEPGVMTPDLISGAATWSDAEFGQALRTGMTPAGDSLDPEAMPWPGYSGMTDAELTAIHRYLGSLQNLSGLRRFQVRRVGRAKPPALGDLLL